MSMKAKRIIVNIIATIFIIAVVCAIVYIGNYIINLISGKASTTPFVFVSFCAALAVVWLDFTREMR